MNVAFNMAMLPGRLELFGLPVADLSHDHLFALLEECLAHPAGRTIVSFLTAAESRRVIADPAHREQLRRHLVLPQGRAVALAARIRTGRRLAASHHPQRLAPAFLTYVTRPLDIGLAGGPASTLEAAAAELRRHAPWHSVRLADQGAAHDLLLVGPVEGGIERLAAAEAARLVLPVGRLFEELGRPGAKVSLAPRRRVLDRVRLDELADAALLAGHALRELLATGRRPAAGRKPGRSPVA